jgi:cell division protease FtsH
MKFLLSFLLCLAGCNSFFTSRFLSNSRIDTTRLYAKRKYPLSKRYDKNYMKRLKRLNSKNVTEQTNEIINEFDEDQEDEDDIEEEFFDELANLYNMNSNNRSSSVGGIRIIINKGDFSGIGLGLDYNEPEDDDSNRRSISRRNGNKKKKSDNFEVISKSPYNFTDIGGYDNIKLELQQCIDILSNHTKYASYNVRTPKGIIFEGPPGNGKTLFAKALAGEAQISFITVSGSEFQEKYVGVGGMKVRELFTLARENVPCIIFIDEIDAIGRKRSTEGELSTSERDSTLNELLIALDGFKNSSGIFLVGATNRADLLDPALIRPGRVDKRIFIGNPDEKTRKCILDIHLQGKPMNTDVNTEDLIEQTNGFSAAQIENLLNEAMLNALRFNRQSISNIDVDTVVNKMMVGWQPNEHKFTNDIIDKIAIHELGHAVVGILSKHHSKMKKVMINLSAPTSPAYTIFENTMNSISTREALFEHLMILLAGRIAEEVFYEVSVSTGAINDFEEALKLAQKMVVYYGMGENVIYPSMSEKYKEKIDTEVASIINDAYAYSEFIVRNSKDLIFEGAEILKKDKILTAETLIELMNRKYKNVFALKIKR